MSALIVDPEHINVLIWARPVRCLTVGRALRANWPPPAAIWPVAPHRFSRQQGRQAYTAGTPSPSTCTAAGSPVSARASPTARLPLRRAAPTALARHGRAPRALARPRGRAQIRFQLFRLVPVDGATPRWTADPR